MHAGPSNPVQQGADGHVCADCGVAVARAGRPSPRNPGDRFAYGPYPDRCPFCLRLHRRRAQLRAYIVSASKLAASLGKDDLAVALHRLAERAR